MNWGIICTARFAREKMIRAIIRASSDHACAAIASRDGKRAADTAKTVIAQIQKELGRKIPPPKTYGSYDALLDDPDIQIIYIPLPNALHHEWVVRAAQKGKHVLCEKPMVYSLTQLEEIMKVCEENKVAFLEAHSYFLHPQHVKLAQLLDDNVIGKVVQIHTLFSYPAEKKHKIRFSRELGGGSLLDIGCYGIDFMHRVFKEEPREIYPLFQIPSNIDQIQTDIDMEFTGIFKFSNGAECLVRTSFIQPRQQSLLIQGETGTIFLPNAFIPSGAKAHLFVKNENRAWVEAVDHSDQLELLVKTFEGYLSDLDAMKVHHERYTRSVKILEELIKRRDQ